MLVALDVMRPRVFVRFAECIAGSPCLAGMDTSQVICPLRRDLSAADTSSQAAYKHTVGAEPIDLSTSS